MEDQALFSNSEISSDALPQIEQLNVEAISSKYRMANLGINTLFTLLLFVLGIFIYYQKLFTLSPQLQKNIPIILMALVIFWLLKGIYQFFADKQKFYGLREQDLSYMSGLFFKKTVTQPILRIQHIELKRGPIDRKLELAKIQVFSAGGATHTFEIPGLHIEKAEAIRQFVLDHKDVNNHG